MPISIQPVIVTADLPRLVAFYSGLLGAQEVGRFPEEGEPFYVGLQVGGSILGITANADAADVPAGRVLIDVDVEDLATVLPRVEPLGGTVLGPPADMPWGQRVAHVHDPDGTTVNLSQRL